MADGRSLNVENEMDDHVESIDMFELLDKDNINFRLGVLRRTVFFTASTGDRFFIDDDIIMKYFAKAIRDADSKGLEEKKGRLFCNRFAFMRHYINRVQYAGHLKADFNYLQAKVLGGAPMVIVNSGNITAPKDDVHARCRIMRCIAADLCDANYPDWHYAIMGEETTSNTIAIWSDKAEDAESLKRAVIAEAFLQDITTTITVEGGYADYTVFDNGQYEVYEQGPFTPELCNIYIESIEGKIGIEIDQLPVTEKWVTPLREVYKDNKAQQTKLRKILEANGFDTSAPDMNPDDIDNMNWSKLFKLATDTEKPILP